MSISSQDRLYKLLPAIHRIRDVDRGEPLRALMAVIEEQLLTLEDDVAGLYENWFIETCDEWVLPYLADLLGVEGVRGSAGAHHSHRAFVANTIAYRRRKGTAAALEQMTRDLTGWPTRVVEMWQQLATTQHLNHLRPAVVSTPNLRDTAALGELGTAFSGIPHTVDVRPIGEGLERCNIPNVGLFVWRLQSYALDEVTPFPVGGGPNPRYRFHPMGFDGPIANRPVAETEISHLAEPINLPGLLTRRALYDELEAYRQGLIDGDPPDLSYFDADTPVFEIRTGAGHQLVDPAEILICNLEGWPSVPTSRTYQDANGAPVNLPITVGVDPELGRIAFATPGSVTPVTLSHSYLFSADTGAGPYDRQSDIEGLIDREVSWQRGVSADLAPESGVIVNSVLQAVLEWNSEAQEGDFGIICVMDSRAYPQDLGAPANIIRVPPRARLLIVAADWPESTDDQGIASRTLGVVAASGLRPLLSTRVGMMGDGQLTDIPGEVILDGFLIDGRINIQPGHLGKLTLSHCTQLPRGGLNAGVNVVGPVGSPATQNQALEIGLSHSITGTITVEPGLEIETIVVEDSIVDPGVSPPSPLALAAPMTSAEVSRSTLLGTSHLRALSASETIFTGEVSVERRQSGCVRYSYLPQGSSTPKRYRCQPDMAIAEARESAGSLSLAELRAIRHRTAPVFTSKAFPHPGYGQLAKSCPSEIFTGSENGGEMGAFNQLGQALREADLESNLERYLRFGLEAGLIKTT